MSEPRLLALRPLVFAALALASCTAEPPARCPGPPRPPENAPIPAGLSPEARAAIADLESSDFATRTRAGERLVAMGEDAIPALVSVGDRRVLVHGTVEASVTRPVLEAVLEGSPADALEKKHLASSSAFLRRAAARELGRRGRLSAVPALAGRLDDDDPAVRAAAAAALKRLTERFPSAKGLEGAAAWRAWGSREGSAAAAGERAGAK